MVYIVFPVRSYGPLSLHKLDCVDICDLQDQIISLVLYVSYGNQNFNYIMVPKYKERRKGMLYFESFCDKRYIHIYSVFCFRVQPNSFCFHSFHSLLKPLYKLYKCPMDLHQTAVLKWKLSRLCIPQNWLYGSKIFFLCNDSMEILM